MILLSGNSVSFFPVMQTNFSEMCEAQFQSITLVPCIPNRIWNKRIQKLLTYTICKIFLCTRESCNSLFEIQECHKPPELS